MIAVKEGRSGDLGPAENLRCLKLGESQKRTKRQKQLRSFSAGRRFPRLTVSHIKIDEG